MPDDSKQPEKRLEIAIDIRNFEIELFWKRSLFFWGFIGAAFVAFAALYNKGAPELSLLVACFGLVCSAAWTLVNRGSKYWYENWEQKVEREEVGILGEEFFARKEPMKKDAGWWLQGRRFSVTRLAIALSDFTVLIWFSLMIWMSLRPPPPFNFCMKVVFIGLSLVFVIFMGIKGRSSPPP